jgi:5'-3' exonuclease
VRFANEHVLRAFLCYLGGGQLPGLERIGEETSVELVEQRLEAFKKYYAASSKELEKLDEEEVARGVREVYRRYLFLDNVDKAYKEG